ncbi:MAG: hypothetical protein Q8P41_22740 [Pseudomonadota bacterium]|nr:hypothetical protein [Pseudomonadota bacterium]
MNAFAARLAAWWFPEAPAERLAAVRIATGGFVLWQLVRLFDNFAAIARTPVAQWSPVGPLRLLDAPLSPAEFDTWNTVHVALAACFFVGLGHRVLAPIYAVSTLFFFSYRTAWGGVLHADNLFTLHILCLALGPAASAWSVDAWLARRWPGRGRWLRWSPLPAVDWRFGWNLLLMGAVTTITYFLAGVAKVVSNPGFGWASGKNLLDQIGNDALYKELVSSGGGATPLVPWLYQHPEWLLIAATGTLVIEVGAPLALLDRRLGWVWSLATWSMHQGIALVMGIVFPYPGYGFAFVGFFPVDRWIKGAAGWVRRRRGGAAALGDAPSEAGPDSASA